MDCRVRRSIAALVACLALPASIAARAATLDYSPDAALGVGTLPPTAVLPPVQGGMGTPSGLAVDPVTGALWVSDFDFSRVLRFASAEAFATGLAPNLVLGQADFVGITAERGTGGASANNLYRPKGIALDGAGRLFVADSYHHRVLVFKPPFSNGMDASEAIGQADFTGNLDHCTPPSATGLCYPSDVKFGPDGDLWVADGQNRRVLGFPAPHRTGMAATRLVGSQSFTAQTNPFASAETLADVEAIAFDGAGNLWVTDFARVLRFPPAALNGTRIADLVLCSNSFTSFGSNVPASASNCGQPGGIAVDASGVVYLGDLLYNRILVFTTLSNGAAATTVVGQSSATVTGCGGQVTATCNPQALAITPSGHLLAALHGGLPQRVVRYDVPRVRPVPTVTRVSPSLVASGGPAFRLTVIGTGFHGDSVVRVNGVARPTEWISTTRLVATIPASDIASLVGPSITVSTPVPGGGSSNAGILLVFGSAPGAPVVDRVLGQPNFTQAVIQNPDVGEDIVDTVTEGNFAQGGPYGVAVDPNSGRVFVADRNAHRVLSWPSDTAMQSAQAADLILGQPDFFSTTCNTGGIGAATLCTPTGIAVDSSGGLYVVDTDNHRVLYYAPPLASAMPATRVYGQLGSFTTRVANQPPLSMGLSLPGAVAVNNAWLFVHDAGNSRILVFDPNDGDTVADRVIGQPSLFTNQPTTPALGSVGAGFGSLALDAAGRLYFADGQFNRVLRFSPPFLPVPPATGPTANLVLGQPLPTTSTANTTATGLRTPTGIAVDAAGNVAVVDSGNHRVVRYTAPLPSGAAATHLIGQVDFLTATTGANNAKVNSPKGVAFDRLGNVYVTDANNHRTLRFGRPWPMLIPSRTTIDFGGQSMGTTSPAEPITFTLNEDLATVSAVTVTGPYTVTHDCGTLPAMSATCTVQVTFTPQLQGAATGTLTVTSTLGTYTINLAGVGEKSLVTHYYRSILRRAPDAPGKVFWESEATRMQSSGANLNEAWFAMAQAFYASAEYAAFNRDTNGFVTDLYTTFFNRAPDGPGLAFWAGQVGQGMPREVVLAAFMFSAEFTTFTQSIFGNTQVRREVDTVTDFYRGLLARLPDGGGFSFWVGQFRAAQCQGAAAVTTQAESISSSFATGGEYAGRARSNAQYVGDLYNAFLRRGGDLAGVQFWINALDAATLTREQVRQQFVASAEFQARVQQVIAQGCLP